MKLTTKQIKVLNLILPYPVGRGLTYKTAAERLKISISSITQMMRYIKKHNPFIYQKIVKIRRQATNDRQKLNKLIVGSELIKIAGDNGEIKKVF